jgi:hypothetical protein
VLRYIFCEYFDFRSFYEEEDEVQMWEFLVFGIFFYEGLTAFIVGLDFFV